MLCAFMVLSHGGIVAAHSHYAIPGHDGVAASHVDDHASLHASDHDDDHDRAATGTDDDGSAPQQAPIAHSHGVVDAIAKAPVLARVSGVTLRFEPPLRRDVVPPSATVAPGLEPPNA